MKKDTSTESWGKVEMSNEWIRLAQTNPHRLHFIMPFTLQQLGDVSGKAILDLGCGEVDIQENCVGEVQRLRQ